MEKFANYAIEGMVSVIKKDLWSRKKGWTIEKAGL